LPNSEGLPWDPERGLPDEGDIMTDLTLSHGMIEYSESAIVGIETEGNGSVVFSPQPIIPVIHYSDTPVGGKLPEFPYYQRVREILPGEVGKVQNP